MQERGPVASLSREPGPRPVDEPGPAAIPSSAPPQAQAGPPHTRRLLWTLAVGGVVLGIDQLTKSLAEADLHGPVHLLGPFGLALGYNSGSAFSLFPGRAEVLAPLAVAIAAVLLWLAWRSSSTVLSVALGLVMGGAMGNVADRALRGHHGAVVDFITLTHWPTFNVADACITVGSLLLAFVVLRRPRPGAAGGPSRETTDEP